MTKELSVDEQTLQRKTRHRLMGAALVSLLMVVILPMLLDSEPKPSGQNISLDIPPPDKAEPFTPQAAPASVVAEAPTAESTAPQPAVAPPEMSNPPAETAKPADISPPAVPEAPPKPVARPKPVVVIPPTNDNKADARYWLQVGNYSNPNMAAYVAEKLRANYLKVSVEKDGGVTRLRVGPFTDKAQAEKARQLLLKQGTRTTLSPPK